MLPSQGIEEGSGDAWFFSHEARNGSVLVVTPGQEAKESVHRQVEEANRESRTVRQSRNERKQEKV